MLKDLISLLYPHLCLSCNSKLNPSAPDLCIRCESQLPLTRFYNYPNNEASQLFWGRTQVENAFSAYHYVKHGVLQDALYAVKYDNQPQVGRYLGRLTGNELKSVKFAPDIEALVPVPLHPDKLKIRGYNQAEQICLGISDATSIPVDTGLVTRTVFTNSQTKKGVYERSINVDNVFSINEPINYKTIAVVDDVLTTGSTMISLIQTLHKSKPNLIVFPVTVGLAG